MSRCSRRRALGTLGVSVISTLQLRCSPLPPVRVAAHPWPGYELVFMAAREGWLRREDALLLQTTSATDSLRRLQQGAAATP